MHTDIGNVIAERTLEWDGQPIRVLVGEPRPFGDHHRDYLCPYRFEAADGSILREFYAGGVDSVQALVHALTMIGDYLSVESADVTFMGLPAHGFPVTQLDGG